MAEAGLLTLLAPGARPLAPQATALPVLAAYHDLRWLFADGQSWPGFAGIAAAVLLARSATDTLLLRLAWPQGQRPPRLSSAFWSSMALTALAWLLLSPAVTLAFGVAVLPFSWPFLAALPIMGGIAVALSHGGTHAAWWRRLPPLRSALWLLASLIVLSAAAAVIAHLGAAAAIAAAGVAGVVDARIWYGVAASASRVHPRPHSSAPARLLFGLPLAPLAGLLVLALVVGAARLMFTGAVQLPAGSSRVAMSTIAGGAADGDAVKAGGARARGGAGRWLLTRCSWSAAGGRPAATRPTACAPRCPAPQSGSSPTSASTRRESPCRAARQTMTCRCPELGDRDGRPAGGAAQPDAPPGRRRRGKRGHPRPLRDARPPPRPAGRVDSAAQPDRRSRAAELPPGGGGSLGGQDALDELDALVGSISPYGPGGARELLGSVGEFGAGYFGAAIGPIAAPGRLLAVVPLADALTLPALACRRKWSSSRPSTGACSAMTAYWRWSAPSWRAGLELGWTRAACATPRRRSAARPSHGACPSRTPRPADDRRAYPVREGCQPAQRR